MCGRSRRGDREKGADSNVVVVVVVVVVIVVVVVVVVNLSSISEQYVLHILSSSLYI